MIKGPCKDGKHTFPRLASYRLVSADGNIRIRACNSCLSAGVTVTVYGAGDLRSVRTTMVEQQEIEV